MPQQKRIDPIMRNSLISILSFLKHKAEDKGVVPVISVAKLIDLLKTSGMTITYQQLLDMTQDPAIAQSIKSINKNQVTIALSSDEAVAAPTPQEDFTSTENNEEDAEDEFNPDDFNSDGESEDFGSEDNSNNNYQDNEEPQHNSRYGQQKSTVSNMAKRALGRAD